MKNERDICGLKVVICMNLRNWRILGYLSTDYLKSKLRVQRIVTAKEYQKN